jgi:hypothetical protein
MAHAHAVLSELQNGSSPLSDVVPTQDRRRAAFAAMMRERPDAILVSKDPFHQLHIGRIIEFLSKNRLPAMFQSKESVAIGGFIGYGPSLPDLFRRAASHAIESCKAPSQPICQWSCRRRSILRSI